MLTELHIENLGVIERASLLLRDGVTALSGETGAGKTMLVEAIGLLVGERADPSVVRSGATEARIDGRFEVPGDDGEVGEIVVSRVVLAEGRSRAYINGRPATVASLAETTRDLIDLHGQHAHQSLMSPATQRSALDVYGGVDLAPLRAARARLTELDAELATLGGDERARAREIDLLRFQVAELDAANIVDEGEDLALAAEEALLADAVAHREAGETALDLLRADDRASDSLGAAILAMSGREPFAAVTDRLNGVLAELDDVVADLRDLTETIEEQPQRLAEIRERRQLLVDLRRKYGDDLGEIMVFHRDTADRLAELENYDRRAGELDVERAEAAVVARHAAAEVRQQREAAAPALAAAIEERLRGLAMSNAAVGVSVDGDGPGDDVRFLLSANPGSPLLPLQRVASGGELARTMLALRLVLVDAGGEAGTSSLVFDEVDAGIGGSAAVAVGRALADLGAHHQVLIVTHLPQVAAQATTQMVVSKSVEGDATFTSVAEVAGAARVAEIARMLAGSETDAALQHARDLLQSGNPARDSP